MTSHNYRTVIFCPNVMVLSSLERYIIKDNKKKLIHKKKLTTFMDQTQAVFCENWDF